MRKFGMFFFALFALTVIFAGCANQEKEPKKTKEEATPTVSLLPQDAPVFSSDELFFPNTDRVTTSGTPIESSSSGPAVSTTTAKVTSSPSSATTSSITSSSSATTSSSSAYKGNGVELPDHNW